MLHAAGILIVMCDRSPVLKKRPIANKYVFQMAFGGLLITMRKFLDLWTAHIELLLPQDSAAYVKGKTLAEDATRRRMWSAASALVAHYARRGKHSWPLTPNTTMALVAKTKFADEDEILEWSKATSAAMVTIRDALNQIHGVTP